MTNQSNVVGRRSLRAILSTVIALVLILAVFASTALADSFNQYDLKIIDGSQEYTITTNETEPIEILKTAGITLSADDKMDIRQFEQGVGGTILIKRLNTIHIEFGSEIQAYSVYSTTVGDALAEIGLTLNEKDKLNYSLDDFVKDGMVIAVKSAFSVSLKADGKTKKYTFAEGTVADLLTFAGITLGKDDYTQPKADEALKADMTITVYRVEHKTEVRTEKIKFTTKEEKDSSLAQGKTKVITKGVKGERTVTYDVKYVNGKEESKTALSSTDTKQPVQKVVKVGTKKVKKSVKGNGIKSKNGYSVGQTISGRYTHYCACAKCNGNSRGITSSGRRIRNGMANPHYVACNWLPLGTVISVDGTNYTVVDRGGSGLSRKGRIDIFTPEGHSACYKYGTGKCKIKIIRLGW